MSDEALEVLYSGPQDIKLYGRDVTSWRWFIMGREVVVEISNTAMEMADADLGDRIATARRTKGESEIQRVMDWEVPPTTISISSGEVLYG